MAFEYKYEERYKYLTHACFNLTDACNLACRYCFVEQHPHYMTLQVAKDGADWLYNNLQIKREKGWAKKDEKAHITYFGGEPTLLWDEIIVPLTLYVEEKYPNEFNFSITTNGTRLNEERIDFLYDHKIGPLLSIDGAKTTQDYNRPCQNHNLSSFDLVYKNIPYLLEKFPNTTFRSTIHQDTAKYTFENYYFAIHCGFKNIFMIPNGREQWSQKAKDELKAELEKIYVYMGNEFANNRLPINCSLFNDSFERVLKNDLNTLKPDNQKEQRNISRIPRRCGLGTTSGSIGYDGRIYGCQEQNSKDLKNIFLIGSIYEGGINEELHNKLLAEYAKQEQGKCSNEALCETCKFKGICTGFACPSTAWDLEKSFRIDNEMHCLWFQWMFDNSLVLMHAFKDNKVFQKYLNERCKYKNYFKGGEKNGQNRDT